MYSDSTLKSFTKEELIDLLHLADYNYRNLEDTYERSVSNASRIFRDYDKVFKKACEILGDATKNGFLPFPRDYFGIYARNSADTDSESHDYSESWRSTLIGIVVRKNGDANEQI